MRAATLPAAYGRDARWSSPTALQVTQIPGRAHIADPAWAGSMICDSGSWRGPSVPRLPLRGRPGP